MRGPAMRFHDGGGDIGLRNDLKGAFLRGEDELASAGRDGKPVAQALGDIRVEVSGIDARDSGPCLAAVD